MPKALSSLSPRIFLLMIFAINAAMVAVVLLYENDDELGLAVCALVKGLYRLFVSLATLSVVGARMAESQ